MTKGKAIRLIKEAIEKHGKDFTLYGFRDVWKHDLDELKDEIGGGSGRICYDQPKYICGTFTLGNLLDELNKDDVTLTDRPPFTTGDLPCYRQVMGMIERNIEEFTHMAAIRMYVGESQAEYESYVKDHTEEVKGIQQKHKDELTALLGMAKQFNVSPLYV